MKVCVVLVLLLVSFWNVSGTLGQHCPPIVESYLESVSVKHVKDGISIQVDYKKSGGQLKNAYQAYLVVYSDSDSEKHSQLSPQEAIESKLVSVLHTQLAKRREDGCYGIQYDLKTSDFVMSLLESSVLDHAEIDDYGGWRSFRRRIRMAVFIPFLEDRKFSVIEGLPEERHECNYRGDDGLIFEPLPQLITVHFGVVQAIKIPEGEYKLQINGHRRAQKPAS